MHGELRPSWHPAPVKAWVWPQRVYQRVVRALQVGERVRELDRTGLVDGASSHHAEDS